MEMMSGGSLKKITQQFHELSIPFEAPLIAFVCKFLILHMWEFKKLLNISTNLSLLCADFVVEWEF